MYRPDLEQEDPFDEKAAISQFYEKRIRSVIDVPFSHGTLALNSDRPHAFSEDQVEWLGLSGRRAGGTIPPRR